MKKRNLPLSLLLIFIVLGGLSVVFYSFNNDSKYVPRSPHDQLKSRLGKPAAQFLAQIKNNQHTGVINPGDIKLLNEEMEHVFGSRASSMEWIQMGPDNFGGRTRAILCKEGGENSVITYAAGVTGGIWKSDNLGTTWKKVNVDNDNLNVSCMIESSNGDIYVGTGETYDAQDLSGLSEMGYTSGFMGQGIYKSTDGENFILINSTKPTFNNIDSDWAFVNELAISPANGWLWASTNTGLKYSENGGETWATATDDQGQPLDKTSWDVQVGSDGNIVACVDNLCYVSTDGSSNFVLRSLADSIIGSLPNEDVSRIEFAIAPSDSKVVYASVVNGSNSVYNIYKSNDEGINWQVVMPGTNSINVFNQQGVYNNAIAVFPNDPGKVLLGGIDLWQGEMFQEEGFYDWKTVSQSLTGPFFPTYVHEDHHTYEFVPGTNNQFFAGTDGGVFLGKIQSDFLTYETGNRNYYTTQFYAVGPSGEKQVLIGGSQDVGTIKITGDGNTKEYGEAIFDGEGGPCAMSLIYDDGLVITTTDGIIRRSDDGGENYSSFEQFPTDVITNPAFRTPILLSENFDNQFSSDTTWFHATETIPGGTKVQVRSQNAGQPFPYYTPDDLTLNAGDSIPVKDIVTSYLFVGVRHNIWLTTNFLQFDEEAEWFELSNPDYGFIGAPYSMALSADGNHLFVGTIEGKLYRVSNLASANTYERADVNSPGCIVSTKAIELLTPGGENVSQVVTSIAIDSENHNNVIVTLGNYGNDSYILYSENALAQAPEFKSKQGNLPHMPIYSSVLEMTNPDMAILGTEKGVFVSENIHADSPQWNESTSEMGRVPVFELKQQTVDQPTRTVKIGSGESVVYEVYEGTKNFGSIYSASYGRGLFRSDDFYLVDIEEPNEEIVSKLTLKLYPNPVKTSATIEVDVENSQDVTFNVYDLSGRMVISKPTSLTKGLNKIGLKTNGLERGSYIVKALIGGNSYTQKFIVN